MKSLRICFALAMVCAFGLQSCTPDDVRPQGSTASMQASWEENAIHSNAGVTCSEVIAIDLAQANGSAAVDYCGSYNGSPIPCPTNVPNWGMGYTSNMRNTDNEDIVNVQFSMAPTWFVTNCVAKVAAPQSFAFDQNGIPIVDNSWTGSTLSPAVSTYDMSWNLGTHYGPQCVAFAARITVVKINFFNPVHDPLSVRSLWVYNANYNNPARPDMISSSPLLTPWCLAPCPGDLQPRDETARVGGGPDVDDRDWALSER